MKHTNLQELQVSDNKAMTEAYNKITNDYGSYK